MSDQQYYYSLSTKAEDLGNVIKVVLLAHGKGATPLSYRPNADESQWWNRRDALVRCVIAYLFCYNNTQSGGTDRSHSSCSKELIFVFDEDWSTLSMTYTPKQQHQLFVPSERAIIDLWKRATKSPGVSIEQNGLSCLSTIQSTTTHSPYNDSSNSQSAVINIANKRDVLDYLQATCSMEFLRHHKLNSSVETLIRKTNKTKLLDIKKEWERECGKKRKVDVPSTPCRKIADDSNNNRALESIFQQILHPQSSKIEKVIAATLHESSVNELPCWDDDNDGDGIVSEPRNPKAVQICFFLGAVRDMYKTENHALRRICDAREIPLLRIRLGPVSEFTSKILTVLAYHDSYHRLVPACLRLILRSQEKMPSSLVSSDTNKQQIPLETMPSLILHFICHVPMSSDGISTDLMVRNRLMWCIVRCIVTSLWRSRLASGKSNNTAQHNFHNRLSFLFQDSVVFTLDQMELVPDMAEKHQAAPSEYQILSMVRQKLDTMLQMQKAKSIHPKSIPEMFRDLFLDRNTKAVQAPSIWIDFSEENCPPENHFYKSVASRINTTRTSSRPISPASKLIAIAIPLLNEDSHTATNLTKTSPLVEVRKAFCDASTSISTIAGRGLVNVDCIDQEAVFITMIQHLAYQERLVKLCDHFHDISTSRKANT